MKKIILGLALMAGVFTACSEDKLDMYSGGNYLQFKNPMTDSVSVSFMLLPGQQTYKVGLPLYLIGRPSEVEREYICEVYKSGVDDAPAAAYTLPQKFTFAANAVTDTLWLTCNLTPEMTTNNYRLVLLLKESKDFGLGSNGYNGAIIRITNMITKPDWWTTTCTNYFLGAYSDAKYRVFIKVTGVADFDSSNPGLLREYTNQVKRHLIKMKEAGTPELEDDGSEMSVKMAL